MHIPDQYVKAFSAASGLISVCIQNTSFETVVIFKGSGYHRRYLAPGERFVECFYFSEKLKCLLEAEPTPPDSVIYTLSGTYLDSGSWIRFYVRLFGVGIYDSTNDPVQSHICKQSNTCSNDLKIKERFIDGVSLAKLLEWDEAERRDLSIPVPRRCWSDAQRQAVSEYRSEELRGKIKAKQLADVERERSRVQIDSSDDY
jgi:hypothetical protein